LEGREWPPGKEKKKREKTEPSTGARETFLIFGVGKPWGIVVNVINPPLN